MIHLVREYGLGGLAVTTEPNESVVAYHFVTAETANKAIEILRHARIVNVQVVDSEEDDHTAPMTTWRPADGLVELTNSMQKLQKRERARASLAI